MNGTINKIYGKNLIKLMSVMVKDFADLNYDEDDIYNCIKQINESIRIGFYLLALELGNGSLAFKLNRVNKRINQERLEIFKYEFNRGNVYNYLASLGKIDKESLLSDLNLDVLEQDLCKLSKLNRQYYDAITSSILADQKNDCRNGIDVFLKYHGNKLN